MRLDKFLCQCGKGSRRDIKLMAKQGLIQVNGKVVKDTAFHIDENNDVVTLNLQEVKYKKYIYLMLNKPSGYVSATFDKKLPTVADLVPEEYRHYDPFPVGRLDIDTHGLLILTNDGDMCHRVLSPKSHIKKKYYVELQAPLNQTDIDRLEKGITLEDGYTALPANIELLEEKVCHIVIYEGKFHQVKRMFEAVDNKVTYLKRVSMGDLVLDTRLEEGEVRELTDTELFLLNEKENL